MVDSRALHGVANFQLDQNRLRPEQKCVAVAQSVFAQAGFALFLLLLYNLVLIKVKKGCNLSVTNNVISALSPPCFLVSAFHSVLFVMSMTHLWTGLSFATFLHYQNGFRNVLRVHYFCSFIGVRTKYAQCCSRHLKPKSTASAMLSERRLCLACLHFSTQHSSGNFSRRLHFPIAYFSRAPLLPLCVAPRLAHICCGGVPVSRVYLLPLKV